MILFPGTGDIDAIDHFIEKYIIPVRARRRNPTLAQPFDAKARRDATPAPPCNGPASQRAPTYSLRWPA